MGLKEGRGICIDTDVATGIATIGLCDQRFDVYTGTVQLGGFNVEIKNGEVVDVTRVINLPAGTYTFGKYDVTINEYGSITNIVERTATTGDDYMGCEYVGIWNQLISNDPALENMNNYVRDFILEFDAPKDSQWVFTIDYKGAFLIDGVLVNGTNVLVPASGNSSGALPFLKLTDAFNFTPSVSADAGISVSVSAYSRYVFRPNMTFAAGHYEVRFRVNTDEYVTNWVRLPQFVASIKLVGNAAHSLVWVNKRD